jgi:hypothetical protein
MGLSMSVLDAPRNPKASAELEAHPRVDQDLRPGVVAKNSR